MDITSLPSLTDFFEGADQWGEVLALLPVLVLLELILSADNAVALAAIARSSRQPDQERLALNLGIGMALLLRIALIVVAPQWIPAWSSGVATLSPQPLQQWRLHRGRCPAENRRARPRPARCISGCRRDTARPGSASQWNSACTF